MFSFLKPTFVRRREHGDPQAGRDLEAHRGNQAGGRRVRHQDHRLQELRNPIQAGTGIRREQAGRSHRQGENCFLTPSTPNDASVYFYPFSASLHKNKIVN